MKKLLKIVIILAIIGLGAAFIVYKFVYNQPHTNFEKAKAEFSLTAVDFYNEFINNKEAASAKYNGKVVEITSEVSKIESDTNIAYIVFVFSEGVFGDEGIRCDMLPDFIEDVKMLKTGDKVTVKGYCTGYNDTDVIMENCSIIK